MRYLITLISKHYKHYKTTYRIQVDILWETFIKTHRDKRENVIPTSNRFYIYIYIYNLIVYALDLIYK